jgi:hypothetical protein
VIDVAYVVRPGQHNPELRYSLRSLANLPHRRVWIAGHKPNWVAGVHHIPTEQNGRKHGNARVNLQAIVDCDDATADVVLMNDDFYIMKPLEQVPVLHMGPVDGVIDDYRSRGINSTYLRAMIDTRDLLLRDGYGTLSYDLHTPFVVNRRELRDVLASCEVRLHWRTIYGNRYGVGGTQVDDCKIRGRDDAASLPFDAFLSTSDSTFRSVSKLLASAFPDPSPYEVQ